MGWPRRQAAWASAWRGWSCRCSRLPDLAIQDAGALAVAEPQPVHVIDLALGVAGCGGDMRGAGSFWYGQNMKESTPCVGDTSDYVCAAEEGRNTEDSDQK